jgi:protoheme IX farnesyltransferase
MTDASLQTAAKPVQGEAEFRDYFALMKPRVMSLVVFTALVGLLVAPVSVHPFIGFCAILFIAIGAGASGSLNMWWDADIDSVMKRTCPPPHSGWQSNARARLWPLVWRFRAFRSSCCGWRQTPWRLVCWPSPSFFYAVIYSIWLKRATPQNIVIGGAAGAFPPMIGWVVATGSVSLEAVLMFAIIFMWTPPHFWALALFMKTDYDDARVPMLTVTHGRKSTRIHVLVYTLLLFPVAVGTAFTSIGGPVYLAVALFFNIWFLKGPMTSGAAMRRRPKQTNTKLRNQSLKSRFITFLLTLARCCWK